MNIGDKNHGFIVMPDGNGGWMQCPEIMTEEELIRFLRIPEITKAKDPKNVIKHLKRNRNLPCIHICNQSLYPVKKVLEWIDNQ